MFCLISGFLWRLHLWKTIRRIFKHRPKHQEDDIDFSFYSKLKVHIYDQSLVAVPCDVRRLLPSDPKGTTPFIYLISLLETLKVTRSKVTPILQGHRLSLLSSSHQGASAAHSPLVWVSGTRRPSLYHQRRCYWPLFFNLFIFYFFLPKTNKNVNPSGHNFPSVSSTKPWIHQLGFTAWGTEYNEFINMSLLQDVGRWRPCDDSPGLI